MRSGSTELGAWMPVETNGGVGRRIAYYRGVARPRMTQRQLADAARVALGTIRKIERGERGAVPEANDPLLAATVAYVRTETFFAARAHSAGLRALHQALDLAPAPTGRREIAARGALHMRAAVVAGRVRDASAVATHLSEARALADRVPEGVYLGTAFGPECVRIHEVAVAVSLGGDHVGRALDVADTWEPPKDLPAERRSGFYIELARAQLWSGLADDAFESLKLARHIAPQHTRQHPWVREDVSTLRRLKRSDAEALTNFAEWCSAV
ncbi:conserved hypothetical protein [Streptomyces sp. e14]|nr:conserved hypothetical protein [Streptomyces sp. e14]